MPWIWGGTLRGLGRSPMKHPPIWRGNMDHQTAESYLNIAEMDAELKMHDRRLSSLEKAVENINAITVNIERLAVSMEQMNKELEKQGTRLDKIEERPAKRWDTVVSGIISGIVGILIGLLSAGVLK